MRRVQPGDTILLLGGYPDPRQRRVERRRLGERAFFEGDDIEVRVVEATLGLLRAAFSRGATIAMSHEPAVLLLAIAVASEYWRPESAEPVPEKTPSDGLRSGEQPSEPKRAEPKRAPIALVDYNHREEPQPEPDYSYFADDSPSPLTSLQTARILHYVELADNPRALDPSLAVCIGGTHERVSRTLDRFAYDGPIYAIGSTSGAAANRDFFGRRTQDPEESLWDGVREAERSVSDPEEGKFPARPGTELIRTRHSMYPLMMSLIMDGALEG